MSFLHINLIYCIWFIIQVQTTVKQYVYTSKSYFNVQILFSDVCYHGVDYLSKAAICLGVPAKNGIT